MCLRCVLERCLRGALELPWGRLRGALGRLKGALEVPLEVPWRCLRGGLPVPTVAQPKGLKKQDANLVS